VTILAIVGALTAISSSLAAWMGLRNHKKIAEVHILVNNRLDEALLTIKELEKVARQRNGTIPSDTKPGISGGDNR